MSEEKPIITIEDGKLQGTVKLDWLGGKYYNFQGIPYAKPPLGKLRFKAPQPVDPWTDIRDASKEGSDCYSRHLLTQQFVGTEDCLYLNVYTPQLPPECPKPKAVMVWIHGGAFTGGSGSTEFYGPDFLITEDVVIVTINYRVGLLGFAYFADKSLEISGNAAFKDQVLALKWVQKNISKFGGDPDNVTLFGESAGGASVHVLMLSPLTKGLFHKVISQSGVSTSGWSRGQLTAPLVAKVLNLENADETEIAKILTEMSVEKLLEMQDKLPDVQAVSQCRPFGLVMESAEDKSAFLSRDPQDILNSGSYFHVPFMIGYTSREGMLMEMAQKQKYGEIKWISNYENVVPRYLQISKDSELSKNVADKIQHFYYGTETASINNIDQYYLVYSDTYFFIDINNAVRAHAKTSSCPTYYYRVSVDTRLNVFKKLCFIDKPGVSHSDELGYLFKTSVTPEIRPRSLEDISLRRFVKLWTTFAKTGDPNPLQKENLINVTWRPTENNELYFLDIGENLTVGVNPESERVAFWDEIHELSKNK